MPENYYKALPTKPAHLSVGAVLLDEKNQVVCHHYKNFRNIPEFYLLMRETVEPGESLEAALARGLKEEFGAEGEIITYVGSYVAKDYWFGEIGESVQVQKTTLYFIVRLTSIDEAKRLQDHPEYGSILERKNIEFLITEMKKVSSETKINDINESTVLESVKKYLERHSI